MFYDLLFDHSEDGVTLSGERLHAAGAAEAHECGGGLAVADDLYGPTLRNAA
jgi:hypothetical protein